MSASTSISTPFSSATSLRSKLSAGSGDGSADDDGSGSGSGGGRASSAGDPCADVLSASLALTDLAFGIYAVELWRYDEATGKLVNVDLARGTAADEEAGGGGGGGLRIKRRTQESDPTNDYSTPAARDAYERLTCPSRADFLPATSVDPGVGLPGALWAEEAHSRLLGGAVRKNLLASVHHHGHVSHRNVAGTGGDHPAGYHGSHDGVSWRDVGELADDPDQVSRGIVALFFPTKLLLCRSDLMLRRWRGTFYILARDAQQLAVCFGWSTSNVAIKSCAVFLGSRLDLLNMSNVATLLIVAVEEVAFVALHSNQVSAVFFVLLLPIYYLTLSPTPRRLPRFQPHDERLQAFAKAGFSLAAGVPFDIHGYRGLVVYFGNPRAEAEKLRNPANARFLGNAAQVSSNPLVFSRVPPALVAGDEPIVPEFLPGRGAGRWRADEPRLPGRRRTDVEARARRPSSP
ncbi:hypothetical protein ACHAWF_007020 [Thalassiosira exigua]